MKLHHYLSSFGSFAAILLSLMPGADSRAQDVQAQLPRAAPTAVAPTLTLTACSPDGEFYAVATPDGRIKCGKTQDGTRSRPLLLCHPRVLTFSPDGRFLAGVGGANGSPAKLKVWRVADGALLCKVNTNVGCDPLLCFSADGLLLISTGEGSRINLWQLPDGKLKWSLPTGEPVSRLAFSKEGKAVIAIFTSGSVQRFAMP